MLGSFILGGQSMGSLMGGQVMKIGRRKTLIIANFMFIGSCGLTQYLTIYTLLSSRIL